MPGELPCGRLLSAHNPTVVVVVVVVTVVVTVVVVVVSAGAPLPAVAVPHHSVWGRGQACLSQRQDADS